jgi:hypothetical protein
MKGANRMDKNLEEKINKEVEKIIESYNDETIKTKHNFNVLKRRILKEKYGIEWRDK